MPTRWYVLALLTPPLLRFFLHVAVQYPLAWPTAAASLVRHAAIFVAVSLVVTATYTLSFMLVRPNPSLAAFVRLYPHIVTDVLPKLVLAFIALYREAAATLHARAAAQAEKQRAHLAVQLAQAQVRALESQLHPHFLFNTLDSMVALVRDGEAQRASRAIVLLSEMIRSILSWRGEGEAPLEQELDFVRRYVELEHLRFEERLRVTWAIEPGLEHARVLPLLLQPLVENAFRHGIEKRRHAGQLVIGARTAEGAVELFVEDDGPGPGSVREPPHAGRGVGLASTRARLLEAYGNDASVTLAPRAEGGTRAVIRLPGTIAPGTPTGSA